MKDYFSFIFQNKKLLLLLVLLFVLTIILISVSILQKGRGKPAQPSPVTVYQPTPSPLTTYLPQDNYKKIFDKDIKDLHWLNNNELSYTFYDQALGQRVLAKINLTQNFSEAIMIKDARIKLSELFWSADNNLLIFDYGSPYITRLYNYNLNQITATSLNGYGYSWSADGDAIFYYDLNSNPPSAKIYNAKTNFFTATDINNIPAFIASYWSPSSGKILLYDFSLETGSGEINTLDLRTNSTQLLKIKASLFPSWSPKGDQFAYVSKGGIYIATGSNTTALYDTDTNPQYISYAWISENNLIVLDSGKSTGQLMLVSTETKNEKVVLPEIKTQADQRAQFAVSPDSNFLAIALGKDGLWIVKRSFIY